MRSIPYFGQTSSDECKDHQYTQLGQPLASMSYPQQQLTNVSALLSGMTNLQHLNLAHNALTSLAPIYQLKSLLTLNLSHNLISVVTQQILDLQWLSHANLEFNRLSHVQSVRTLKALADKNCAIVLIKGNPIIQKQRWMLDWFKRNSLPQAKPRHKSTSHIEQKFGYPLKETDTNRHSHSRELMADTTLDATKKNLPSNHGRIFSLLIDDIELDSDSTIPLNLEDATVTFNKNLQVLASVSHNLKLLLNSNKNLKLKGNLTEQDKAASLIIAELSSKSNHEDLMTVDWQSIQKHFGKIKELHQETLQLMAHQSDAPLGLYKTWVSQLRSLRKGVGQMEQLHLQLVESRKRQCELKNLQRLSPEKQFPHSKLEDLLFSKSPPPKEEEVGAECETCILSKQEIKQLRSAVMDLEAKNEAVGSVNKQLVIKNNELESHAAFSTKAVACQKEIVNEFSLRQDASSYLSILTTQAALIESALHFSHMKAWGVDSKPTSKRTADCTNKQSGSKNTQAFQSVSEFHLGSAHQLTSYFRGDKIPQTYQPHTKSNRASQKASKEKRTQRSRDVASSSSQGRAKNTTSHKKTTSEGLTHHHAQVEVAPFESPLNTEPEMLLEPFSITQNTQKTGHPSVSPGLSCVGNELSMQTGEMSNQTVKITPQSTPCLPERQKVSNRRNPQNESDNLQPHSKSSAELQRSCRLVSVRTLSHSRIDSANSPAKVPSTHNSTGYCNIDGRPTDKLDNYMKHHLRNNILEILCKKSSNESVNNFYQKYLSLKSVSRETLIHKKQHISYLQRPNESVKRSLQQSSQK